MCVTLDPVAFDDPGTVTLWHYDDLATEWSPITTSLVDDVVCGQTDTFSQFAVLEPERPPRSRTLDPGFGTRRRVHHNLAAGPAAALNETFVDSIVQPDGKVLVLANADTGGNNYDFEIVRYDVDGALDPTFGGGAGYVQLDLGPNDYAMAFALGPDGSIGVVGASTVNATYQGVIFRLDPTATAT